MDNDYSLYYLLELGRTAVMTIFYYIDLSFDKPVDSAQFLWNMFHDSSQLSAWCE